MPDLGRGLIVAGIVLVAAGIAVLAFGRPGGFPIPLGRLPGDISIQREGFSFYLPITSSIVVSIVLSAVLYLLRR